MAVLFLDPLALALLIGLLVYAWLVWRGTFRRWFGRPEAWTVLAWPVPLLVVVVPLLAGGLLWLVARLGIEIGDVADAVLYAAVYAVPATVLAVWPPRVLLPGWARDRLTSLNPEVPYTDLPAGAMPAVRAERGHGSRARWAWRVDGVAGHVWVDGPTLRFRSMTGPAGRLEIDEQMVAELQFADAAGLTLATPRGGAWTQGRLDVALSEVDQLGTRAVVPWHRDGLLIIEVAGRRPLHLWVADIRRLERLLVGAHEGPTPEPDRDGQAPA